MGDRANIFLNIICTRWSSTYKNIYRFKVLEKWNTFFFAAWLTGYRPWWGWCIFVHYTSMLTGLKPSDEELWLLELIDYNRHAPCFEEFGFQNFHPPCQRSPKTEGKKLHISQTSFRRTILVQPICEYIVETIFGSCRGIPNDPNAFSSHRHWEFQAPCPHQVHQPQRRSNFRRRGLASIGKTGWILQHFVWEEPVIASRPLNSTLVWPTIYPLGMLLLEWWLNMHLGLSRKSSRRTSLLQSKSDSHTILSIVGITAPTDTKEAKIDGNS